MEEQQNSKLSPEIYCSLSRQLCYFHSLHFRFPRWEKFMTVLYSFTAHIQHSALWLFLSQDFLQKKQASTASWTPGFSNKPKTNPHRSPKYLIVRNTTYFCTKKSNTLNYCLSRFFLSVSKNDKIINTFHFQRVLAIKI